MGAARLSPRPGLLTFCCLLLVTAALARPTTSGSTPRCHPHGAASDDAAAARSPPNIHRDARSNSLTVDLVVIAEDSVLLTPASPAGARPVLTDFLPAAADDTVAGLCFWSLLPAEDVADASAGDGAIASGTPDAVPPLSHADGAQPTSQGPRHPRRPRALLNPTLRVAPGDTLCLTLYNGIGMPDSIPYAAYNTTTCEAMRAELVTAATPSSPTAAMMKMGNASTTTTTSTNLHFHGLHVSPHCGSDDTLTTVIHPGQRFRYTVAVPASQPPGLYWYHPHHHPHAALQVTLGAVGVLVVEGLEVEVPAVQGLDEDVFVLRAVPTRQPSRAAVERPAPRRRGGSPPAPALREVPKWDIVVNRVGVRYPQLTPARLALAPMASNTTSGNNAAEEQRVWRILNGCSDLTLNLTLVVQAWGRDGSPRRRLASMVLVATDGAPVAAPAGLPGVLFLLIPSGGRREVIVTIHSGTDPSVPEEMYLMADHVETSSQPAQPIALVSRRASGPAAHRAVAFPTLATDAMRPHASQKARPFAKKQRAAGPVKRRRRFVLDEIKGTTPNMSVYFLNEVPWHAIPAHNRDGTSSAEGPGASEQLAAFTPAALQHPPTIVAEIGTREEWLVENRAANLHSFHIHQTHFQLLAVDGVDVQNPAGSPSGLDAPTGGSSSSSSSSSSRSSSGSSRLFSYFSTVPEARLATYDTVLLLPRGASVSGRPSTLRLAVSFEAVRLAGVGLVHCHMLRHGDMGMMQPIEFVVPGTAAMGGGASTGAQEGAAVSAPLAALTGSAANPPLPPVLSQASPSSPAANGDYESSAGGSPAADVASSSSSPPSYLLLPRRPPAAPPLPAPTLSSGAVGSAASVADEVDLSRSEHSSADAEAGSAASAASSSANVALRTDGSGHSSSGGPTLLVPVSLASQQGQDATDALLRTRLCRQTTSRDLLIRSMRNDWPPPRHARLSPALAVAEFANLCGVDRLSPALLRTLGPRDVATLSLAFCSDVTAQFVSTLAPSALLGLSDACIARAPPTALQGLTSSTARALFGHGRAGLRFLAAWQNLSGLPRAAALEAPRGSVDKLSLEQCASLLSSSDRMTDANAALAAKATVASRRVKPSRKDEPAAAVPELWTGCYQRLSEADGHHRLERGGMVEAGSRAGLAMGLNALAAVGLALVLVVQYARKRVHLSFA